MVAFRKLFPVLAVGAFLLGTATTASAQVGGNPLICDTSAGVPPVVRAEGHTELVGDIIIQCRGGNVNQAVTANFQVFLNTNITSRLLGGGLSEALLLIDEPGNLENGQPVCPSPNPASNSYPARIGNPATSLVPGLNVGGLVGGGTAPTCNPTRPDTANQVNTYNVFRAQTAVGGDATSNAAVVWAGVPIVPPGTNGIRTIRITNIRANAAGVPASASLVPSQIFAFISISASQSLALNNPQQAVAFVLPGLQFDVRTCNGGGAPGGGVNLLQCQNNNGGNNSLANLGPADNTRGGGATFGVRFREGFQTAFKTRIAGQASGTSGATDQYVSVPGVVYNTESGYVRPELNGLGNPGLADTATRVAVRFNNIPEGVRLFVSTSSVRPLAGFSNGDVGTNTANATLVSTDNTTTGTGFGNVQATATLNCPAGNRTNQILDETSIGDVPTLPSLPAAEVNLTGTGAGRSGMAVWEVNQANSTVIDTLFFYVGVAYTANTPNNLPGLGTSTVTGSFAPFFAANANAGQASQTLPIPRFLDTATARNAFVINQCVTNLLFPFVTNQAGFDTGIAISNTSRDPFNNNAGRVQSGTCTINYYGSTPGGPAPAADTTTNPVDAGGQLLFVLSSGGANGIDAVPGFQGYIIAQCRFQYAHGFAFITDGPIGQAQVAEGYLALVMDSAIGTRTGSASEVLSH